MKIRGNAPHVSEKYLTLARDAQTSGDPIAAENYLQHAEHYLRIIAASQAQQQSQAQPCAPEDETRASGGGRGNGSSRSRGGSGRSNGDGRKDEAQNAAAEEGEADTSSASEAALDGGGETIDLSEDADEVVATAASDEPDSADKGTEETVPETS